MLLKIKKSVPYLDELDRNDMFNRLFPQTVNYIEPARYILERTYFRPRDIITYLNFIIKKYPQSTYFGWKGFTELEYEYSKYFLQEVRNELSGHIKDEQIDEIFLLLKQYNKYRFKYGEIKEYLNKNKVLYGNIELDEMLATMFKFNVIGNFWENNNHRKMYYCWSYRDNQAVIDYDKGFVIHLGLRRQLSI